MTKLIVACVVVAVFLCCGASAEVDIAEDLSFENLQQLNGDFASLSMAEKEFTSNSPSPLQLVDSVADLSLDHEAAATEGETEDILVSNDNGSDSDDVGDDSDPVDPFVESLAKFAADTVSQQIGSSVWVLNVTSAECGAMPGLPPGSRCFISMLVYFSGNSSEANVNCSVSDRNGAMSLDYFRVLPGPVQPVDPFVLQLAQFAVDTVSEKIGSQVVVLNISSSECGAMPGLPPGSRCFISMLVYFSGNSSQADATCSVSERNGAMSLDYFRIAQLETDDSVLESNLGTPWDPTDPYIVKLANFTATTLSAQIGSVVAVLNVTYADCATVAGRRCTLLMLVYYNVNASQALGKAVLYDRFGSVSLTSFAPCTDPSCGIAPPPYLEDDIAMQNMAEVDAEFYADAPNMDDQQVVAAPVDPTDPYFVKIAQFAVQEINVKEQSKSGPYTLVTVNSADCVVVAGRRCSLSLTVSSNASDDTDVDVENLRESFPDFSDDLLMKFNAAGLIRQATAVIYDRFGAMQLVEYSFA